MYTVLDGERKCLIWRHFKVDLIDLHYYFMYNLREKKSSRSISF